MKYETNSFLDDHDTWSFQSNELHCNVRCLSAYRCIMFVLAQRECHKINQRKTPFLGYLTSRSKHLEFLFLSVDKVTYLPSYRLVILSYAQKSAGWVWRCRIEQQWTLITVLKTLGFLVILNPNRLGDTNSWWFQVTFWGTQIPWWLKNRTRPAWSYAPLLGGLWRLEGGEVPALWTRVNHIPLKGQKNKRRVVLGSTQDSFYSEGKCQLVQIWQRQTALFSVLKEFWAASFGFCYLSSSLRSHRNRHHNRWRLMIPKPYGESTHVKLGPFFFRKKTWTTLPTFKVDSLKQPSKLLL